VRSSIEGGFDVAAVVAAMPVGLAVIDRHGVVRSANEQFCGMLGRPLDELVGRSMMEFAYPDDLEFAAEILANGDRYGQDLMGPVRLRYVDGAGHVRLTEFWARNFIEQPGVDGYVITVAEESVADKLSDAVRSIASGQTADVSLAHVVDAMSSNPVIARANVLTLVGDAVTLVGQWPLSDLAFDVDPEAVDPELAAASPWSVPLLGAGSCDIDHLDDMHPVLRSAAASAGIGAVWTRPVVTSDHRVAAALVVWRPEPGPPSPNQRRRLDDAVAIAALALDQVAHRESLERAVYTDPLTGLGNRARLTQVLADPTDRIAGVLYVDLDRFKSVNDCFGHLVGDEVLALVGTRLGGIVRDGDDVIRVGGDEFVVLCRPPIDFAGLTVVADRIERVLSEPYSLVETSERAPVLASIGASVGIAVGDVDGPLIDRIAAADRAMYAVKQRARTDRADSPLDELEHESLVTPGVERIERRAVVGEHVTGEFALGGLGGVATGTTVPFADHH
jgi:diguanylate cyclase (GGDEF)-like protein/PAS domain S-box-containing protein